jgi:hypothetical protein
MSRRSPRFVLIGAWLLVGVHVIVFNVLQAWPYARIVFRASGAELNRTLSRCRDDSICRPDAVAFLDRQTTALDSVIVVVRGTVVLTSVIVVTLMVLATIALLTGRPRGAGRLLGAGCVVHAVVSAVLLLAYVGLLIRGQVLRGDVPPEGRILTFDVAFDSPLTDLGTLYYVGWFVLMNAAVAYLFRSLSRDLWAAQAPAPAI